MYNLLTSPSIGLSKSSQCSEIILDTRSLWKTNFIVDTARLVLPEPLAKTLQENNIGDQSTLYRKNLSAF